MANQIQFTDIFQRALDANVQYYTSLSQLAAECLQALVASVTKMAPEQQGASSALANSQAAEAPQAASRDSRISTIVLEGEAGGHPLGVFLIENGLSHQVSAPIVTSAFVDSEGREIRPKLAFEPETIRLDAGEQVLVRIMAVIDKSLEPTVSYRGEISVPGLQGTRIPVVLRRRAPIQESKRPRLATEGRSRGGAKSNGPRGQPGTQRRRSARKTRA